MIPEAVLSFFVKSSSKCNNPSYCLMLDDPWFHGSNIIVLCSGSIITPAYMVSKGRHSSSPFLCAVLPPSICARVNIRSLACHYRCCRHNERTAEKSIIFSIFVIDMCLFGWLHHWQRLNSTFFFSLFHFRLDLYNNYTFSKIYLHCVTLLR